MNCGVFSRFLCIRDKAFWNLRFRILSSYLQNLSLWGWYFFHINPGHRVPTRLRVSRFVTSTITDPESHADSAHGDILTHSFNMARAVQVLWIWTSWTEFFQTLPKVAPYSTIIKIRVIKNGFHHVVLEIEVLIVKNKIKGVFSGSYCCYGSLLCHENDNSVLTNDWPIFNTMTVTSTDKEWL